VQVAVEGVLQELDHDRSVWIVEETVNEHERRRTDAADPQRVSPRDMQERTTALSKLIRGYEVMVTCIEGRFKLSQNRSDSAKVARLLREGDDMERAVGVLMEEHLMPSVDR
jgi:predicted FMN-binding regulatory protein PaiB